MIKGSDIPSNVLFIGGNQNFVNKIKAIYPGWVFINPKERNSQKVRGEFDLVIIQTNYTSHNIIERVMSKCNGTPVIYSNHTNINMVENDIKMGLAKVS